MLDDWFFPVRLLMKKVDFSISLFFIAYLLVVHFTLLTLVAGVTLQNVLLISRSLGESEVEKRERKQIELFKKLKKVHEMADISGDGRVEAEEFRVMLNTSAHF